MSMKTYVKAAILSSVLIWNVNSPAYAVFPTFDCPAVGQFSSKVNTVQSEIKTQIESTGKLGNISQTLGDPKGSISKFAGDKAAKSLKDAEKAKKKADKLKKIKETIEKSKKEYQEKKEKYDKYKKQIEQAKKDYKEAKDMANDAMEVTSMAGDLANQAVSDATGGSKGKSSSSNTEPKNTNNNTASTTQNQVVQANRVANKGNTVNSNAYANTGVSNAKVSGSSAVNTNSLSRTGGSTAQTVQTKTAITSKTGGLSDLKAQTGSAITSKAGGLSDLKAQTGSVISSRNGEFKESVGSKEVTLKEKNFESVDGEKTLSGRRPFNKNALEKAGEAEISDKKALVSEEKLSEKDMEVNDLKEKELKEATKGEAAADEIKKIAKEQGAMEAANTLKSTVARATRENDIQTLDAVSQLKTSDIVVSDSKKYEETPTMGRKAFSKPDGSSMSSAKESIKAGSSSVSSPKAETKELGQSVNKVEQKSQSLSQAPQKASGLGGLLGAQKKETLGSSAVKADKSLNQKDLKAAPAKTLQKNSYWLGEEKNNIKLSFAETLRFGDAANDCSDYNYSIQSSDNGEVVILPKELAKKYCIKVDQLKDYQVIQDFLEKFALEMNGRAEAVSANPEKEESAPADASVAQEAQGQYSVVLAENTKNNAVAASDDLYTSMDYPNVFEEQKKQIKEQQGGGATERDHKSMLALTSKSMTYLLNQIRKIEATSLLTSGFEGVRKVSDETLKTDQEIGIPAEAGEYEASVTIGEGNYPILPESLAKKCQIKVSESAEGFKSCLAQVITDLYATDNEDVKVAQAFMERIKYEEAKIAASKGIEQLIRSAEFDEKLAELQEKNADATDVKGNDYANATVNSENNTVWTDFNRLLASSTADTALNNLDALTPISSASNKG